MHSWFGLKLKRDESAHRLATIEERLANLERRIVHQEEEVIKLATALVERIEAVRRSRDNQN